MKTSRTAIIIGTAIALGLVFVLYLSFQARQRRPETVQIPTVGGSNIEPSSVPSSSVRPNENSPLMAATSSHVTSQTNAGVSPVVATSDQPMDPEREARIDRMKERFSELSGESTPTAMSELLQGMKDADPMVRKEALEWTIQFGSRDAIPELQKLAEQTTDNSEKIAIMEAIEYLKLPSLTEVRAQKRNRPPSQTPPSNTVTNQ